MACWRDDPWEENGTDSASAAFLLLSEYLDIFEDIQAKDSQPKRAKSSPGKPRKRTREL